MAEEMQCPRRVGGIGYGYPGPDRWERNRWGKLLPFGLRFRWKRNIEWPSGFKPPRTCSYCGGIHPEDAISLLEKGWEIETTDKDYKVYLHPPGHHEHRAVVREAIRSMVAIPDPEFPGPTPPVKVYRMHFNRDQIRRLNQAASSSGG